MCSLMKENEVASVVNLQRSIFVHTIPSVNSALADVLESIRKSTKNLNIGFLVIANKLMYDSKAEIASTLQLMNLTDM